MAPFSLTAPYIHVHDVDMTGYLTKITLHPTVAELDVTTFGSTYRSRIGGLKSVEYAAEGFWDSVPDLSIFSNFGTADLVATISPEGAEQKVAYIFQLGRFDYSVLGNIGDAAPFSVTGKNTNSQGLIRGQLAKARGNVSATGQLGSVLTITGPSATQYVYAAFHVFIAGTTITVQVQSAPASNFAAPTTRGTIGPITVAGGAWLARVIGPFTDGFWRLNVSAVTGAFNVAGAIGIQ
jgi:hypothetical protein